MTQGIAERKSVSQFDNSTDKGKDQPKYIKENILNYYRSYTYNFTLAVVPKTDLSSPDNFSKNIGNYFTILKSSGKGTKKFNPKNSSAISVRLDPNVAIDDISGLPLVANNAVGSKEAGEELVKEFNERSPGRFDMYIDNVEITTLPNYNQKTRTTLGSKIDFDIFEPYSAGGLMQALHVGAVSAGFKSYLETPFLLKISFVGYPDQPTKKDQEDVTDPVEIENTIRFFLVRFSDINVELTEKGTRYRCSGIPFNESAFGKPNLLPANIKITNKTKVKDVLKDLANQLNQQLQEINKKSKEKTNPNDHDQYEILFADSTGDVTKDTNIFATSDIGELFRQESVYGFEDYGNESAVDDKGRRRASNNPSTQDASSSSDPGATRHSPNNKVIQFRQGQLLSECIEAIIRDSEYTVNLLKELPTKIDDYGLIDYFIIDPIVESLGKFDDTNRRELFKYTYVIRPFKVHFTKIRRYQSQLFNADLLSKISLRNYDYFYTGKNKDVLNFKINLKTLFFEAVPKAMGNSAYDFTSGALGPGNRPEAIDKATDSNNIARQQIPTPAQRFDLDAADVPTTGNAGKPKLDAFSVLVRSMHQGIIDSKAGLVQGDLEIIGDPVYLVTPSPGFRKVKTNDLGNFLNNGEMNYLNGDAFIRINFKNPVDINDEGFYEFDEDQAAFGGVYRLTEVRHSFKEGVFRQTLSILRVPGQITKSEKVKPTQLSDKTETRPNRNDTVKVDVTVAQKPSRRSQGVNLLSQIQGLVSAAASLPGEIASSLRSALTAPITESVNEFNNKMAEATQSINGVTSKITSAINNVNLQVAEAGQKLGLSSQRIQELSKSSPLALAALVGLAKTIPKGVNLKESIDQGVNLNFPSFKLPNLPPTQPKTTAPVVEQNQKDVEDLLNKGGVNALAAAFGTKDVKNIPGGTISDSLAKDLLKQIENSAISNPLRSVNNLIPYADLKILADRSLSQLTQSSNSVEVNLKVSGAQVDSSLDSAVTVKFGSKVSSPLEKLKDNSNI